MNEPRRELADIATWAGGDETALPFLGDDEVALEPAHLVAGNPNRSGTGRVEFPTSIRRPSAALGQMEVHADRSADAGALPLPGFLVRDPEKTIVRRAAASAYGGAMELVRVVERAARIPATVVRRAQLISSADSSGSATSTYTKRVARASTGRSSVSVVRILVSYIGACGGLCTRRGATALCSLPTTPPCWHAATTPLAGTTSRRGR